MMIKQTIPTQSIGAELLEKIRNESAVIGVIGLGYVGLPLIDAFVWGGFSAMGFDVDQRKVDELNDGKSYIAHIPDEKIAAWNETKRFEATTDMSRMAEADLLLICVPTPLNDSRDPDLSYVIKSTEAIAQSLRPGQLIALESTTYPGTTRDVILPILEKSGLKPGEDFFLAYSPEREDPGNPNFSAHTIPKVIGGHDSISLQLAVEAYSNAVEQTVPVDSLEIAEACKILENTYRSVNIAMVNELKVLFQKIGIDIWQVIEAAKTKPFGFQAFYPGPGLGGHCIPIDPFYLSWVARKHETQTKFIELAGEINTAMPMFVISRVVEALNSVRKPVNGSRIGVLGVAYKKDVDDSRESPSLRLIELLNDRGAELSYCDPHVPVLPKPHKGSLPNLTAQECTPEYLQSLDCVLISTDHTAFDWEMIVEHAPLIIDTRNATKEIVENRSKIWKA